MRVSQLRRRHLSKVWLHKLVLYMYCLCPLLSEYVQCMYQILYTLARNRYTMYSYRYTLA